MATDHTHHGPHGDSSGGSHQGRHPLTACVDAVEAALKDVAGLDPLFAPVGVKRDALVELTHLVDRVESLRMRVMTGSGDVVEAEAAHSIGAWLAPKVRTETGTQTAAGNLAADLQLHHHLLAEALETGVANLPQTKVINKSLTELRRLKGVTAEILAKAEEMLVAECARLTPTQLKTLGDAILQHIDPDVFDDAERQKLEDELERARSESRLTMRRRGDGSTDLTARIPDALALRFKTYLEAFSAPRHAAADTSRNKAGGSNSPNDTATPDAHGNTDNDAPADPNSAGSTGSGASDEASKPGDTSGKDSLAGSAVSSRFHDPATGERLPHERLMGEALCALLERYDPNQLPRHGGAATTLVIRIDYDTLTGQLSNGTLPDGTRIPASEARRLACTASIIPAVLGGNSLPLDLGRTQRLFTPDQRVALAQAHPTCQASGCSVPSTWCEAHHRTPWSQGGPTNLADGELLCHHHHQRIHDDRYLVERLTNGDIRFARRR